MPELLKALSIRQPWATAIACGLKTTETRSWRSNYYGQIAICASATQSGDDEESHDWYQGMIDHYRNLMPSSYYSLPFGVCVAVAQIAAYKPSKTFLTGSVDFDLGNFEAGRWGWVLENVRQVPVPVPVKGQLGLFCLPDSTSAKILEQVRL